MQLCFQKTINLLSSNLSNQTIYFKTIKGKVKHISGRKRYDNYSNSQHELLLNKGDTLYLTTDGYMDQNSPARKRFGSGMFFDLLKKKAHLSMQKQEDVLE